ncbi:hypothetical protein BH11PSE9_BH11PSE9_28960 [soil metagenome]
MPQTARLASPVQPLVHALGRPAEPLVPWYRVGVMWLFVGGLGVVVVGSFMLLATAMKNMDTVEPQAVVHVAVPNTPVSPAMQARNHAATPRP